MTNVWQIAAGEPRRYYGDLFVEHDAMFMGPGRHGRYEKAKYYQLVDDRKWSPSKIGQIRRFVEKVQPCDVVLLRCGHRAKAIGTVADEDYAWCDTFDDVFGWDLQHTRRVVWQERLKEELHEVQPKGGFFAGARQKATFSAVNDPTVRERVEPLLSRCQERPLKPLPEVPRPLKLAELGRDLFARGLPNDAVDKTLAAIERLRRLCQWYEEHGPAVRRPMSRRPTEHEVVAHMVVPFLLALGWSEQLLAVEWKQIDLAGFSETPTRESNCVLACEAKAMWHGLQNLLDQPAKYVKKRKLTGCQKVLLTDGARLYLYERADGKWGEEPVGYVNVNAIRTRHLVPPNTNAVATIVALTPAGVVRRLSKGP